tara:strand:- start:1856 stop:2887 length:1032 start_codon:yes stop_codon:yes gene_type:complete
MSINRNFSDGLNYLSKFNFSRLNNAAKIWLTFHLSKLTKKVSIQGMPISLAIEPTTSCNLRCPECPSGLRSFTRPTGMLELGTFNKIIDELAPTLTYLTLYFQGEPYLHPQFLDLVRKATTNNIYTATSTNAHYLTKGKAIETVQSGLDRIIISIDGTTQETYEQYRIGGVLDKVLEGTKNLIEAKNELKSKTPYVVFQFLVVKPNEHQIEEAKELAKNMGVDELGFKTAQIYDYKDGNDLIPSNDKFSRYRKNKKGKYELKRTAPLSSCWKMWHSAVMTWDGGVVPCCFDKDSQHEMGNIAKLSFKDIWLGRSYTNFRRALLDSRKHISMCENCTEGTKVYD